MSNPIPRLSVEITQTHRGAAGNPLASSQGTFDDGTRFRVTVTDAKVHLDVDIPTGGASFMIDLNGVTKAFADAIEQHLGKARRIR